MAGDWIKVQCTTPDKPEVVAMAEKLGIDQDAVVGKLLRLWIWADQQTIDGNAVSVTAPFLDRLTYCPGFAAAAAAVGWLIDRKGRLQLPNFDRHNGQTAKSRALTSDRVKRSRNAQAVTETLPEKRREEVIQGGTTANAKTVEASRLAAMNFDPWLDAFLTLWNATPGTIAAKSVSEMQRREFDARRADPWFEAHYRAALGKFPLPFFVKNGNKVGLTKFLEPGFVEGVIEDKHHNNWETNRDRSKPKSKAAEREEGNFAALSEFFDESLQPS